MEWKVSGGGANTKKTSCTQRCQESSVVETTPRDTHLDHSAGVLPSL